MRPFLFSLIAVAVLSFPAFAQDATAPDAQHFSAWLEEFKKEAREQGISQATLDDAFSDTQLQDRVIELDRKQPESTLTLDEYVAHAVTDKRVEKGRQMLEENRALLEEIGKQYGVQPRFIVALWGIETNYGDNTGGFDIVDALATLAYDGRRSEFFRGELIKALQILEQEQIPAAALAGSWAGAMGQCQFMPSSFLKFAVDYDHDGHRDIWNSLPDIFASIANYLSTSGWNGDEGWGRKVKVPKNFDISQTDIKVKKSLAEWQRLGVRREDGHALPTDDTQAALIMVGDGDEAQPYLVYNNFNVILQWNRSRFFATAVGTLADRIGR